MFLAGNRTVSLLLLLAASPAIPAAGHPPDLPVAETAKLLTEDAPTVDPGKTELEFAYLHGKSDSTYDTDGRLVDDVVRAGRVVTLTGTRGLKEGLDAALSVLWRDVVRDDDQTLSGDVFNLVGNVKWRFFKSQGETLLISWLPGLTVPAADTSEPEQVAPGQVYWSLDNLLVLTWVPGRFNLSFNVGYLHALGDEREDQRGESIGHLGVGYQVSRLFQPVLELNYVHEFVDGPGDSRATIGSIGAVFNISPSIRLDAGYDQVVDGRNAARSRSLTVNLSKTF